MSSNALNNREEEALLKATKADALKKCKDVVEAFAACSSGRTISVVWACKDQHKALQECLRQYTSAEAMQEKRKEYLATHRGPGGAPPLTK